MADAQHSHVVDWVRPCVDMGCLFMVCLSVRLLLFPFPSLDAGADEAPAPSLQRPVGLLTGSVGSPCLTLRLRWR